MALSEGDIIVLRDTDEIDLERIDRLCDEVQQYSEELRHERQARQERSVARSDVAAMWLQHPDADLLRLDRELEWLWTVEQTIAGFDQTPEVDAAFEAARDETAIVVRRIAKFEPHTLAGLRVLARACTWIDEDDYWPSGVADFERQLRQRVIASVILLA
jgi:hypothetical protein